MQLKGKTAIITGASSGIGAEFSKALVSKGCRVHGLARRSDRLEQIRSQLGELFIPVPLDVNNHTELEQWVDNTFAANDSGKPTPDILINNAGIGLFGAVDSLPPEEWDLMVQTNLTSLFRLTRLIVPLMKAHDATDHIINIASVAGLIGNPNISGYNATKFAVRGFSEALMKELRNDRIKVTCVYPGSIATEFFDKHGGTHANMLQGSDVAEMVVHLLETPDNFLVDEITLRPLIPKPPQK
ncbi:SDR family NAD(P)-dependent oxidoreductase [Balneolales bacterium ANBcel1]|nr:SDR family NAD(P)-dependent oxidoreductase [Balneolales bacterium ANBcel1]